MKRKRAPKSAKSGDAGPHVAGCELPCAVQGNLAWS